MFRAKIKNFLFFSLIGIFLFLPITNFSAPYYWSPKTNSTPSKTDSQPYYWPKDSSRNFRQPSLKPPSYWSPQKSSQPKTNFSFKTSSQPYYWQPSINQKVIPPKNPYYWSGQPAVSKTTTSKPYYWSPTPISKPVYQTPIYQPPKPQKPIYQPPTFQTPSQRTITYQPPTYQGPTYKPPIYQPPTYQGPTYKPPIYQPPTYQGPTYKPPIYQPPVYQPIVWQPIVFQPLRPQCTPHSFTACWGNDLYWYDSCGRRESKAKECGNPGWTDEFQCFGDFLYRKWIERGCGSDQCFSHSQWKKWQDCSAQGKICQNNQCLLPVNNPPLAEAGPDKEVLETQSVVLAGSGSDPDGDPITFHWSCSGGQLSNSHIAQPIFYSPEVNTETNFLCTLTVTDSKGKSSQDSMNVLVKAQTLLVSLEAFPSSGSAPLKGVDLKATVSGTALGPITYKFDCQNDGNFEYIFSNTFENPKTVFDACDYLVGGTYNAKVLVERGRADPRWALATILVSSPTPVVDLKVNGSDGPLTIPYNSSATLTWISGNTTSCQAFGDWSGTKPTSGSESTGNLVSSKTYRLTCSGPGGSATDFVIVNVGTKPVLELKKLVRNLSDGTDWAESVFADPGEVLAFFIEVGAGTSPLTNLFVRERLPERISYLGQLKIDNLPSTGNIISGLNLANLSPHQKRTITFQAKLADQKEFPFGQTQLITTSLAYSQEVAASQVAKIIVLKKGVVPLERISTGLGRNNFFASIFLPFIFSLILVFLFGKNFLSLSEWWERKRSERELREKIISLKYEISQNIEQSQAV